MACGAAAGSKGAGAFGVGGTGGLGAGRAQSRLLLRRQGQKEHAVREEAKKALPLECGLDL